jgi:hypothetical protein
MFAAQSSNNFSLNWGYNDTVTSIPGGKHTVIGGVSILSLSNAYLFLVF